MMMISQPTKIFVMKLKQWLFLCLLLVLISATEYSQQKLTITLTTEPSVKHQVHTKGRMYLFLAENVKAEPRTQT
ncbi:MAG: hypothetical protein ACI849_000129 [Patiriisocius sp.]|jgi:hypothetical protein